MKVETSTMRRAAQQPDNSGTPRTGQRLRDILAIDERERLIEFAQTWPGRLAAIALAILTIGFYPIVTFTAIKSVVALLPAFPFWAVKF